MLPLLQDDQDCYLRALGASEILTIHGESSGHVFLAWCALIRISHGWLEVMCCICYRMTRMVTWCFRNLDDVQCVLWTCFLAWCALTN